MIEIAAQLTVQGVSFDQERLFFDMDPGYRIALLAVSRRVSEIRAEQARMQETQ